MRDLIIGLLLIVGWGVVQFAVQPATGWFHVALIVGVLMVIRGVVTSEAPPPGP